MGKIIHRYIFREVLTPFLLGLSVFTFILLIARLLKLIELVVNRGLPPAQILRLLAFLMPAFLELTVPMAMLLAILIAFGLSADADGGHAELGPQHLPAVPPVILFVLMTACITAGLSMYASVGQPQSRAELWESRTRVSAVSPQVFNDEFWTRDDYADTSTARTDRLIHVLISDERDRTSTTRSSPTKAS